MKWILGTRGSTLALAQSSQVKQILESHYKDLEIEIKIIKTTGDKHQEVALDKLNDKGVFVKEIEEQLMDRQIDFAIHSMKDMPSTIDEKLCFTKTLLREDPRDVLIINKDKRMNIHSLKELPAHAKIATGSKRRAMQLQKLCKDVEVVGIRGNIETRIQKMKDQQLDGIILAAAGVHRLQMDEYITMYFDEDEMVPACAQGAIAIEVRKEDELIQSRINALCSDEMDREVQMERNLLKKIEAGCHTPFGVRCKLKKQQVEMYAMYGNDHKMEQLHIRFPYEEQDSVLLETARSLKERVEENL